MRHWSFTRMLCYPFRSPFNASSRFPGGARKSSKSRAATEAAYAEPPVESASGNRRDVSSLNSRSVSGQAKLRIIGGNYNAARYACQLVVAGQCASLRETARSGMTFVAALDCITSNHFHEDSTDNTFPVEDWSASMICVYLMLLVKENAINE